MKQSILFLFILSASVLAGHAQVSVDASVSSSASEDPLEQVPTHFVTSSDGTVIAVEESGPSHGKPIVLIHGWSADSRIWFQQQSSPALSQYRIVTMDLRGHGYSGKPTDPRAYADPGLLADDVNAVIQQLHLHRPALIGWSLGAGVMMEYLQKFGQSFISGIDIVDSLACPNAAIAQQASMLLGADPFLPPLASNDAPTNYAGMVAYSNLFASGSTTSSGPLTPEQQLILQASMFGTPVFVRQNYIKGVGSAITANFGPLLASLTVPVLLQGTHNDPIFPQNVLIPLEAAIIRHPTVRFLESGGHVPMILFPVQFNHDLAEWLEELQF
jgi:non-heme chloroperoxidase